VQNFSFWGFSKNLTDGTNTALIVNSLAFQYFKLDNEPQTYALLKERIISEYVGISMETNNLLLEPYNELIIKMTESGIMEKMLDFPKSKPTDVDQPTALSLDHLLIWFKIWIGFLLVTSVVFVIELINGRYRRIGWNSTRSCHNNRRSYRIKKMRKANLHNIHLKNTKNNPNKPGNSFHDEV
jgi:hypothetical protein